MSPYSKADFALESLHMRCRDALIHTSEESIFLICVPNNKHNTVSLFNGQFMYKYLSKLIPKAGYCSITMDYLQNGNWTINSFETEHKEPAASHWIALMISICTLTDDLRNQDENLTGWNRTLKIDFP